MVEMQVILRTVLARARRASGTEPGPRARREQLRIDRPAQGRLGHDGPTLLSPDRVEIAAVIVDAIALADRDDEPVTLEQLRELREVAPSVVDLGHDLVDLRPMGVAHAASRRELCALDVGRADDGGRIGTPVRIAVGLSARVSREIAAWWRQASGGVQRRRRSRSWSALACSRLLEPSAAVPLRSRTDRPCPHPSPDRTVGSRSWA